TVGSSKKGERSAVVMGAGSAGKSGKAVVASGTGEVMAGLATSKTWAHLGHLKRFLGTPSKRCSSYWNRASQAGHTTIMVGIPWSGGEVYRYLRGVAKKLKDLESGTSGGTWKSVTETGRGWLVLRAPRSTCQVSPPRSTQSTRLGSQVFWSTQRSRACMRRFMPRVLGARVRNQVPGTSLEDPRPMSKYWAR